jgi:protein SCO1
MRFLLYTALIISILSGCGSEPKRHLPIVGERDVNAQGDTIYPAVPDFSFTDQDNQVVNNATFAGKVYVVDFFFIHCPTICPKVKAQAKRVYDKYLNDPRVLMLSHSIDTKNDTIAALKKYADKLGIQTNKWHLVTGDHDGIYEIADNYYSIAIVNPDAPGGFDHSGRLILVDSKRHVRSFCDGTQPEEVTRFMKDIDVLLDEESGKK